MPNTVLEQAEQKALVMRCHMENITIISIENSLQFPIAAVLNIVRPYVNSAQLDKIKISLNRLMGILTQKRYAQGMLKGVPDLFIPAYNLFIEMKRREGGVTSLEQDKVHELLRQYGYKVEVCHGAKNAWETICKERGE